MPIPANPILCWRLIYRPRGHSMHHMISSRSSVIGCSAPGWSLKISAGPQKSVCQSGFRGKREPNMLHFGLSNNVDHNIIVTSSVWVCTEYVVSPCCTGSTSTPYPVVPFNSLLLFITIRRWRPLVSMGWFVVLLHFGLVYYSKLVEENPV